jgi:glycosyltransferase involved in cell wall biosynthesis
VAERVAVIYLARVAEGIDVFKRFADSYRKYDAGHPHELILLCKGLEKRGERAYIEQIFNGTCYKIIAISDEGFDINAYLKVSAILDHEFLMFCNTHTEILTGDWLKKMMAHATAPDVGFVGATASYESMAITQKLISKVIWLTSNERFPFDREFYSYYESYLNHGAQKWVRRRKVHRRLRRGAIFRDLFHDRPDLTKINDAFETHWASLTSDNGPFVEFRKFPYFPNPHLRSNCFLINRKQLLGLGFRLEPTKIDCNLFESGVGGLSGVLQRQGKKLLLVGADGHGYDVPDWPNSGTFRLGEQHNLLFGDNQTRSYQALSIQEREVVRMLTWGDYVDCKTPERMKLGFSFEKNDRLLCGFPPEAEIIKRIQGKDVFVSIVIPTHNRVALVAEAIETVRKDRKRHWELVVFDNCSQEPLRELVESLKDDRIVFHRSDEFLPVTESWNRAIAKARGEYVMLLGDDDGLAPNFFEEISAVVDYFDRPDLVYCSFYQFLHPGVAPWQRSGYVSDLRNAFFFSGRELPFVLSAREKAHAIEGSLRLRRNFTFNMQGLVFSRELLSMLTIDGKVFHTPFPDYYIANTAFGMADRIVAHPRPLTIAGVSRQSFGYTLFNNLEEVGAKLLKTDLKQHESFEKCKPYILPGPAYQTNYIVTMQQVRDTLTNGVYPEVDFKRYRRRQIASFIPETSRRLDWLRAPAAKKLWDRLFLQEKLWALRLSFSKKKKPKTFYYKAQKNVNAHAFEVPQMIRNIGDYASTLDLYDALERGAFERDLAPRKSTFNP